MQTPRNIHFLPVLLAFVMQSAFAYDVPKRRSWLLFGLQGGYSAVDPQVGVPESFKDGYTVSGRADWSRYYDSFVFDFGGGVIFSHMTGNVTVSQFSNPNSTLNMTAGFGEFVPKYRIDENFQIGPVFKVLFGTDVSFDENNYFNDNAISFMTGGRLSYDIGTSLLMRVGVEGLTDINIQGRQVYMALLDLQIGFPFGGSDESKKVEPKPEQPMLEPVNEQLVPVTAPQPLAPTRPTTTVVNRNSNRVFKSVEIAQATGNEEVRITLGEAYLRFGHGRTNLPGNSTSLLNVLGQYLAGSTSLWSRVRIEGHTDNTGSLATNDRISLARGESVARQLQKRGLPPDRIVVQGLGPRRPVDPRENPTADAKNRRVEIWLEGVKDPLRIVDELNQL